MNRWIKAALLVAGGCAMGWGAAMALLHWRVSQMDAQAVAQASAQWRSQLAPLWPVLGQPGEAAARPAVDPASVTWEGAPAWRVWPSPRVELQQVRWPVPAEVSSDGWVQVQRLTLRVGWSALWQDAPPLRGVAAQGVSWVVLDASAGLRSHWQVPRLELSAPEADGAQALSAEFALQIGPWSPTLSPAQSGPRSESDTASRTDAPWVDGRARLSAVWVPSGVSDLPHWRNVDLRFDGRWGDWPVSGGHLTAAFWQHLPHRQRLQWADLALSARLGEQGALGEIRLNAPALLLTEQGASGQPGTGQWTTRWPWPAQWQLDSGTPRGRYGEVHWPQWRLALSGQQGTRAAGLLQGDLVWLGRAQGVRWDALAGQWSVQPQGKAERQWTWRGQVRWSPQSADWRLEGQALGDTGSPMRWDGPFAFEGQWAQWPRPRTRLQWRVATVLLDGAALQDVPAAALAGWPVRLWPDELTLQVGYLGLGPLRMSHVRARLQHQGGVWQAPAFSARLWDGQLQGQGTWQAASREWQLQGSLQQADLSLAHAAWLASPPPAGEALPAASGRWNAQWQLSGQGAALSQIRGLTRAEVGPGRWDGVSLRQALGAGRAGGDPARTEWRQLRMQGELQNGVWALDMAMQSPGVRAQATGGMDLAQRTLTLHWSAPASGRGATLAGPWHSLRLRPD